MQCLEAPTIRLERVLAVTMGNMDLVHSAQVTQSSVNYHNSSTSGVYGSALRKRCSSFPESRATPITGSGPIASRVDRLAQNHGKVLSRPGRASGNESFADDRQYLLRFAKAAAVLATSRGAKEQTSSACWLGNRKVATPCANSRKVERVVALQVPQLHSSVTRGGVAAFATSI